MGEEQTASHIVSYPDIKEPHKPSTEKYHSPRKAAVLSFNPDGSLCIPADLKEKLVQQSLYEAGALSSSKVKQDSRKQDSCQQDSRKRKKNELARRRKCVAYVAPPEGCCHFCYTNEKTKFLGELKEVDGIVAHHTCLLFSSGLCQAGKNNEGLWGFLTPHIQKEISRGKRLRCSFCKLSGAVVGCHERRCQHSYHLTCGLDNGCLMQSYDKFRSFCTTHRPRQYHASTLIGKTVECPICGDCIKIEEKVVERDVLVTECCNLTPLHRHCLQNQADASGYFFRCPMCNNEKKFNSIMKIMGINIPQSDASWEKDGYYDDLYVEYSNCDVPICLHPDGRKGDSKKGDKWDLMKCTSCGQSGAHPACMGHDKRGPTDWQCGWCLTCERKYEREREEEERERKEHPELYLPPPEPPGPSSGEIVISSDDDQDWVPRPRRPSQGSPNKRSLNYKRWSPEEKDHLEACFQASWYMTESIKRRILSVIPSKDWQRVNWWYKLRRNKYKHDKEGPPRWNVEESQLQTPAPPPAATSSGASSSSSKRPKKAPLSPAKNPYLWTPDILKEAVFKLCVAQLKKDKVVKKDMDPDSWKLNDPDYMENEEEVSSEDEGPVYKYRHLRDKPFSLALTKAVIPDDAVLTMDDNYDAQKERLWQEIKVLKARGSVLATRSNKRRGKGGARGGRPPSSLKRNKTRSPPKKQITLQRFMMKGRLDQENYVTQSKRRKVDPALPATTTTDKKCKVLTENEYEPFPFKRSPHQPEPVGEADKPVGEGDKPPVLKTPTKITPVTESVPLSSPTASYQCYFCTDKFSKMSIRMEHMRTVHNNRIKSWDTSGKHKTPDKRPIPAEDTDDDDVQIIPSSPPPSKKHPACPKQPKNIILNKPSKPRSSKPSVLKRKRGKKPSSSGYQEELLKYADFTIEVTKTSSVEKDGSGAVKVSVEEEELEYEWSDNEIYSLIEYYSLNPVLWDTELRDEDKEEILIKRLNRKLKITEDNIISKWNELMERYKEERYKPGNRWKFRSHLEFLDEIQLTNCPDDVSPLFSLLSGVNQQDDEIKEQDGLMDIFPDVSSDEEKESYKEESGLLLCSEMMSFNNEDDSDLITSPNNEDDSDLITSPDHLDFS